MKSLCQSAGHQMYISKGIQNDDSGLGTHLKKKEHGVKVYPYIDKPDYNKCILSLLGRKIEYTFYCTNK